MPDNEELVAEQRPIATYAQPLSRLQVSWGSILAGTLAILSVSLILWGFCLSIILSATNATVGSVKGALIAAFVTSIITTLIGAFVGGAVAGYLPGNPRRIISVLHGFIAWSVAFVISAFLHLAFLGGVARTATNVVASTATAAVQTAGAAVGAAGAATQAPARLDQQATNLLEELGYTPTEATSMVQSARADIQQALRGGGAKTAVQTGAQQAAAQAQGALDTMISWAAGYTWLWWATWLVSGALAMFGAAAVVTRTQRVPQRERERGSEPLAIPTLRHARTVA